MPNIVVMTTHDTGRHLGCYGVSTVQTPHIDRFAGEGVRFAQSFCNAPQCSPSRAALFTGRYPHSNGVMGLTHYPFHWDLHQTEKHLAARLREAGWHTAVFGGAHESRTIAEQGFVEVRGGGANAADRVESALSFIDSRSDSGEPFFLEINNFETHRARLGFGSLPDSEKGVYVPPYLQDTIEAREDFALFQGSAKDYDAAVGSFLEGLAQRGLAEDTLVVLTTDHGIPFPRAKCSLYDPGLEAYMIMRWPERGIAGGRIVESPVSHVDFVPTVLDLLGLEGDDTIQGSSYAGLLTGSATGEGRSEAIFAEMTYHDYCDPRRCIRTPHHKLIVNFTTAHEFMDPSQAWHRKTITTSPEHPPYAYHEPVELYDLAADPWEQQNVAAEPENAAVRTELLSRLHRFLVETDDPILSGIPSPPMHEFALAAFNGADGFPFDRRPDHSWLR